MPKLSNSLPKYRKHRHSGQAFVELSGFRHYLGPHGTEVSKREYDRLISEWLANERRPVGEPTSNDRRDVITVVELALVFYRHCQKYYGDESAGVTNRIKVAVRVARELYGNQLAAEFTPRKLKAVRQYFIGLGNSRKLVNEKVRFIKRMFRWGVEEDLVRVGVYQALEAVANLKFRRSEAPESKDVLPVSDETVEATLPYVSTIVADMVQIQRLTCCRPGEVRTVRPCDVDRSGDVWVYTPAKHKTEHHGKTRHIFIGPKAQAVLRPYLLRDADKFCFSPAESEEQRHRQQRLNRKTNVQPSQLNRRTQNRKRLPADCYSKSSYRRAIERACDQAFPPPDGMSGDDLKQWRSDHRWSPNQLRHSAATEIRSKFGLEAAQVALGHSTADITQVYAERDMAVAARVAREVG